MNSETRSRTPLDSPSLLQRIDQVCDAFEARLRAGERPRIEDFLGDAGSPERQPLLRELLLMEVEYRREQGESPSPDDYAGRFPDDGAAIQVGFAGNSTLTRDGAAELSPSASPPGYELLEELGRNMAIVYKARQTQLDRLVALKMIRADQHVERDHLARFRTEVEAIARLQHPNIVQVFEVGEFQGLPFFSMEYCAGGSLERKPGGLPIPPREAAVLVETLARAVQAAHDKGIIHRDLKPANVLLAEDGTPKVSDFGLAKKLDVEQGPTMAGEVLGTPSYMAPEQARGKNKEVGVAADVYALGAILYTCLTGRPPFQGPTVFDTLAQVLYKDPVAVRRLQPTVPRDLETICLKCLQKAPASRFASATALADDLKRFLTGQPIQARPVPLWERTWRWTKRNPVVAAALSAVLLTAVTAFLLIADSRNRAVRLADDNGQLAEEMKGLANDKARQAAEMEELMGGRNKAIADRDLALKDRALAFADRDHALTEVLRTDSLTYTGQIDTAFRAIRDGDAKTAEDSLARSRWEYRGWEYYFARRQLDSARLVIDRAGTPLGLPGDVAGALIDLTAIPSDGIDNLAFSPDGKRVAVSHIDQLGVFDTATGALLFRCPGSGASVSAVAFAPDNSFLASSGRDQTVWIWDSAGRGESFTPGHDEKAPIVSLAISPDSKSIVTGDATGIIIHWDLKAKKLIKRYTDHAGEAVRLVGFPGYVPASDKEDLKWLFAPPGQELLSLGAYGKLVRRNLAKGESKTESLPIWGLRTAALSNRDYRLVLGYGSNNVVCRDLRNTYSDSPITFASPINAITFVPFEKPFRQLNGTLQSPAPVIMAVAAGDNIHFCDTAGNRLFQLPGPSAVRALACNPAGSELAASTGPDKGTVRLWDVAEEVRREVLQRPDNEKVKPTVDAVLSPDGRFLALGRAGTWENLARDFTDFNKNGEIALYSYPDLVLQRTIDTYNRVRCVAISPDARFVASGHGDGSSALWDAATGARVRALARHVRGVPAIAFSPVVGGPVATAGMDGTIALTNLATGDTIRELHGHHEPVTVLAFSPDGKILASGSVDATVRLWTTNDGTEFAVLRGHGLIVSSLAFRADGQQLASASDDKTLCLWDVAAAKLLWKADTTVSPYAGPLHKYRVVFTPDGKRVISLAVVGSPMKGAKRTLEEAAGSGEALTSYVQFWDAEKGELRGTFTDGFSAVTLTLSRDGRDLVCCDPKGRIAVRHGGEPLRLDTRLLKDQSLAVRAAAFSPDGQRVACGSSDRSVLVYDSSTGRRKDRFTLTQPCVCVAFHPTRNLLAYNDNEKRIVLHDLDANESDRYLDHTSTLCAFAFSPNGKFAATGYKDQQARLWDVATGTEVAALKDHGGRVSCLCFSPDGATLFTGAWDGKVRSWDGTTGAPKNCLDLSEEDISSVAVSRDGRLLLAGTVEGTGIIWDLRENKSVATFAAHYKGAVTALVVLSDGTAISAGADGTLNVWDTTAGQSRRRIWVGGEGVLSLAASADGRQLVVGCADGGARLRIGAWLDDPRHHFTP